MKSLWKRLDLVVIIAVVSLAVGCGGWKVRKSEQLESEGLTYLRLGRGAQAEEAFRNSIEADPMNAEAHVGLARALVLQDAPYEQAIEALDAAREVNPAMEEPYRLGVQLLLERGQEGEALELATALQEVAPIEGAVLRAEVLNRSGDAAQAVEELNALAESGEAEPSVYFSLADLYMGQNRYDDAEQALRTVLDELDPGNFTARMKLVTVYEDKGGLAAYAEELEAAVEEAREQHGLGGEKTREARLALARAYAEMGDFRRAAELAEPVLEEWPESGWANYVVGLCRLGQEEREDALAYLETAARALPDVAAAERALDEARGEPASEDPDAGERAETAEGSLDEMMRLGRLRAALEARDRFLQTGGATVRRKLVLAAVLEGAMGLAQQLAEPLPEDDPVRHYVSLMLEPEEEAVTAFMEEYGAKAPDEDLWMWRDAMGLFVGRLGRRFTAIRVLGDALRETPDQATTFLAVAALYRISDMPDYAAATLERIIALDPGNREVREKRLEALLAADKNEEAQALAESMTALFPRSVEAADTLARLYLREGRADEALAALDAALTQQPEQPVLLARKGYALLRLGRAGEAAEALEDAGDGGEPPAWRRPMLLAAYVLQNAQEQAASLCENLEGDALGATRVLCVARRLKAGDEVPAGALVDSQGELLDPRLRLTAAALGVVDPEEEAPSDLLRMLTGDRAMLGRYCAFLGFFELGLYEAAVEEADGLLAGPDPVEGALTAAFQALSQAAMLEDPVARARALAEEHGGSVSWLGLARVAREEGDHDAARNAYERATEADPDNATAWLRFAIYLDTQGEREDALEAYRRAHELDPDNGIVANNLAHTLLQEEGASEEAAELAAQAREALPANPHIAHTLALALFELGRTEEALPHIQMALELRPGDPTFLYDQGRMLVESGQEQEGYNLVQQALLLAERLGLDFPRQDEAAAFLTAGGVEA